MSVYFSIYRQKLSIKIRDQSIHIPNVPIISKCDELTYISVVVCKIDKIGLCNEVLK